MNKMVILSLACSSLLTGCISYKGGDCDGYTSTTSSAQEEKNRQIISGLKLGHDYQNIMMLMGTPDFTDMYVKNQKQYKVLMYRTQRTKSDGHTSKDECTPLVFEEGKLIGWGASALTL
ncbi:DUF3192 domain-containing protein [Algicola sagamiensis]|uniref:DUF3192 domain-containing protein n=1 Tax=Algicola sagamiensis TaxID=163869 RepID=UPI00036A8CA8|nr:DUF3192 domain-containing protein [Algicola sagamiensis]